MQVNELLKDKPITLQNYLSACGIKDPTRYLKYNNIDENPYWHMREAREGIYANCLTYILVDSDCDGYMSATILSRFFTERYGNNVMMLFHADNHKGHGLTPEIMDVLLEQEPAQLFIPDAGSNDIQQMKTLFEKGWRIFCLDHHKIEIENDNPYCYLISNQWQNGMQNIENTKGSGTLVTWKFINYIDHEFANQMVSYVGISIISDSMDLRTNENITFVRWGLTADYLMRASLEFTQLVRELNGDKFTPHDYSFGFITYLNAVIRLGTDEDRKFMISFLIRNGNKENYDEKIIDKAVNICKKYHDRQTKERNELAKTIDINAYKDDNIILVNMNAQTPLLGLVANKVMSSANKTVILVNEACGAFTGSCRSPIDAQKICNESELFDFARGHESAFGVKFNADNFDKIKEYFNHLDKDKIVPKFDVVKSHSGLKIPSEYFYNPLSLYTFYGVGIPSPQYYIHDVQIKTNDIMLLGRNKNTLKFTYDDVDYVKFFCTQDYIQNILSHKGKISLDIIGELSYNVFNGKKRKQVIINQLEIKPLTVKKASDIF